ncbi:lipid II flippase MurJ [subsurface metagenome]
MESSYQKFAKDIIIIGSTQLLVAVSALILLPLLTKTLGAHDYGIWIQANVTIELIIAFVGLGLPLAMIRFLAAESKREEIQEGFYSVFSLVFLVSLIISSIMIAFPGFIARSFFEGATEIVRIVGFIILVWSLDGVFLHLFRTFREIGMYSIFMLARAYGELGLIAYLVLSGHGIFSVVLSVLAIRAALFLFLLPLIKSKIGIKIPNFSRIKEYLNFGLPSVPGAISAWVVTSSDRYVIGYFLGAASVGVYSAGYNLGNIPFMIAMVLAIVLPPTLSKLYDEGRINEVKTHLSYSLKYFLALVIPFVCGAAMLSEPVLRIFSTREIASEAYFIVPLVALSTLFFGIRVVIAQILILVKKTKITGIVWIIAASVNLLLNILIIPHLGILGAAITTLIAYSLALGIVSYYSFKEFKFSIEWSFIIKSLIASAIMSLVIWRIAPVGTLGVILTIVAGVIIYGVILLFLKGCKKQEIRFFKGLFRKA